MRWEWIWFCFFVNPEAVRAMLAELCSLLRQGKLSAPACAEVPLSDYRRALDAAAQPFAAAKQILIT